MDEAASAPGGTSDPGDGLAHWGILLLPRFPLMSFSTLVEALRAANSVAGRPIYRWTTVSPEAHRLIASSGMAVETDRTLAGAPSVDRIVVVSGGGSENYQSPAAHAWIRRELRRGASVGSASDGAFFLARAGLLDGYRCTIHWQSQSGFREAFPHIDCSRELFVIDRDRFSAAGGVATLDMALALLEQDHGPELAARVAEWFVHSRIRQSGDRELLSVRLRTGVVNQRVLKAIAEMEHHIEEPLSAEELAARVGVSIDTLERDFKRALDQTTIQYYRALRFRHARDLLRGASMRISEIAVACGFSDSSSFARAYRSYYGVSPREERSRSG
jgi:transcriptional regulator GlxA family with amidase domain